MSTPELFADIQEQIRRNLPAQVGDLLRAELAELATMRVKHKGLSSTLKDTQDRLAGALVDIDLLKASLASHGNLEAREAACTSREIRLEVIQAKLDCAELRVKDLKEITSVVFRSRVFTETFSGNVPVAVAGGSTYAGFVADTHINTVKTTTD